MLLGDFYPTFSQVLYSTRVTIDTAQVGVEVEFHNPIIKTQIKKPLVKRGLNIIKKVCLL